jgi:hypothetical protein
MVDYWHRLVGKWHQSAKNAWRSANPVRNVRPGGYLRNAHRALRTYIQLCGLTKAWPFGWKVLSTCWTAKCRAKCCFIGEYKERRVRSVFVRLVCNQNSRLPLKSLPFSPFISPSFQSAPNSPFIAQ